MNKCDMRACSKCLHEIHSSERVERSELLTDSFVIHIFFKRFGKRERETFVLDFEHFSFLRKKKKTFVPMEYRCHFRVEVIRLSFTLFSSFHGRQAVFCP
jgi:hypothetical protein